MQNYKDKYGYPPYMPSIVLLGGLVLLETIGAVSMGMTEWRENHDPRPVQKVETSAPNRSDAKHARRLGGPCGPGR